MTVRRIRQVEAALAGPGQFKQGKKRWHSLEEARADVLKSFRRDMRGAYKGHTCVCEWSPEMPPPRSGKAYESSTIWDLSGTEKVPIQGWLVCTLVEK